MIDKFKLECQPWILTHSGKEFDLINPSAEDVCIEDISYSLGMLCRYAGHTSSFYSVAEHCVILSGLVSPPARMYGLLHDAPETYIIDLPGPVKCLFPEYKVLENKVEKIVYEHFGLAPPTQEIKDEVKTADIRMYLTERNQLMKKPLRPWVWDEVAEPFDCGLPCYSPQTAGRVYLDRFNELKETVQ